MLLSRPSGKTAVTSPVVVDGLKPMVSSSPERPIKEDSGYPNAAIGVPTAGMSSESAGALHLWLAARSFDGWRLTNATSMPGVVQMPAIDHMAADAKSPSGQ